MRSEPPLPPRTPRRLFGLLYALLAPAAPLRGRQDRTDAILSPTDEPFSERRPGYPWQLEVHARAPGANETEAERRADFAHFSFGFWKTLLDEALFEHPELFYDEGRGFFRFSDGTFALSRERANWPALKERGFFSDWGM